ncbi:MAG TPA: radical SAM protein [Gemmatimonadaceae bacterium]|nr:radical SAM protein [Gemmatimonadaceae bacterium]
MISITRLYAGRNTPSDGLRYGVQGVEGVRAEDIVTCTPPPSAAARRPVVVWNVGRRCNLHCVHCYSDSANRVYEGELSTAEGKALIDDLAAYRVSVLLLSGGEPLMRADLFELVAHARARGVRVTLSTNGTLITDATATRLRALGVSYVGISLDGIGATNDRFRGHKGAFALAMAGFRNCRAVGQRVGLRMTLTRRTCEDLERIFDFIEEEGIDRACFYHLVYSGRGNRADELPPALARAAMDTILRRTRERASGGWATEIFTVDNPADGAYLYLRLREEDPARAAEVLTLLRWNGGGLHSSGVGIANIDFKGNVHPDQFWMSHTLGNVREQPFSEIWSGSADHVLHGLRHRAPLLTGRCGACQWKDVCGGGFRVRALQVHGDPWAADPACYLTDAECGLVPGSRIHEPDFAPGAS